MGAGQHSAKVDFTANVTSADANVRKLTKRIDELERSAQKATTQIKKTGDAGGNLNDRFGKFEATMEKMTGTLNKVSGLGGLAGFAGAAGAALAAVDHLADRTQKLTQVKNNLRIGVEAARKASNGMISNFELESMAAEALRNNIVKTNRDFAKLVEVGTKLAAVTGQDAAEGIRMLSDKLKEGSADGFKEIGIVVDQEKAYKDYAKALGVITSTLSDYQKTEAVRIAAMDAAIKKTKDMNAETGSWGEGFAIIKIGIVNVVDALILLPRHIGELITEFRKLGPVADGIATTFGVSLRVGFAAITLGASELIPVLIHMNDEVKTMSQLFAEAAYNVKSNMISIEREHKTAVMDTTLAMVQQNNAVNLAAMALKQLEDASGATKKREEDEAKKVRDTAKAYREKHLAMVNKPFNDALAAAKAPMKSGSFDNVQMNQADDIAANEHAEQLKLAKKEAVGLQIKRKNDKIEEDLAKKRDKRQKLFADRELKRKEEAAAAEQKLMDKRIAWADMSAQLGGQSVQMADMIAKASGASAEKQAKVAMYAGGVEATITSITEAVKAAASYASLNIPQGIAHTAASAFAAVQAGLLFSGKLKGAGSPPKSSAGSTGSGGSGSSGGGGGGSGGTGTAMGGNMNDIPGSPGASSSNKGPRRDRGNGDTYIIQTMGSSFDTHTLDQLSLAVTRRKQSGKNF